MECIFCKIVSGELPSTRLAENEVAIAFEDLHPQSPVHILVVPKQHTENIGELSKTSPQLLAKFFELVTTVADSHTTGSYRLQFNTGSAAGQTIFHTHAHILA